jgi:hypothetical protein
LCNCVIVIVRLCNCVIVCFEHQWQVVGTIDRIEEHISIENNTRKKEDPCRFCLSQYGKRFQLISTLHFLLLFLFVLWCFFFFWFCFGSFVCFVCVLYCRSSWKFSLPWSVEVICFIFFRFVSHCRIFLSDW